MVTKVYYIDPACKFSPRCVGKLAAAISGGYVGYNAATGELEVRCERYLVATVESIIAKYV